MLALLSLSFVLCSGAPGLSCSESERKLYPGVKSRNSYKPGTDGACASTCERRKGNDYNTCQTASGEESSCSQADDLDIYGCPIEECINMEMGSVYDFYYGYHVPKKNTADWAFCSISSKISKNCQMKYDSKRLDDKFKRKSTTVDAPHCSAGERKLYRGINGRNSYKPGNDEACASTCERRNGNEHNTCFKASGEESSCSQADDLDIYGCTITECTGGYAYGYYYGYHSTETWDWDYCSKNNMDFCQNIWTSEKLDEKFGKKFEFVDAPAFQAWLNQTTLGMGVVVAAGVLASVALFAFRRRNRDDPSSDIEEQMSD